MVLPSKCYGSSGRRKGSRLTRSSPRNSSSPACLLRTAPLHDRGPAEEQAGRSECLAGPAVEAERVAVLDDQTVAEAEPGLDVVVDVAAGLAEGVVGEPVSAARVAGRFVVQQLDLQIGGARGEHPPHVPGLVSPQVGEHRVEEVRVGA